VRAAAVREEEVCAAAAVLLRSGCPATVAGLRCGTGRGVRKGAAVCGLGAASAGGESKQELEEAAIWKERQVLGRLSCVCLCSSCAVVLQRELLPGVCACTS
jgi:hypothetical protein